VLAKRRAVKMLRWSRCRQSRSTWSGASTDLSSLVIILEYQQRPVCMGL